MKKVKAKMKKTNKEIDDMFPTDTFCALPWMHLSTRPDGSMRVCCTANASGVAVNAKSTDKPVSKSGIVRNDDGQPANLNNTSLMSAWNNEYMRGVRKAMLDGKKPSSCTKCYKEEDAGHRSKRIWETRKWIKDLGGVDQIIEDTQADGSVPARIRYIDLRLGSKCQLACVMCSPDDSSNWIKDHKKIFPTLQNKELRKSMSWTKETGEQAALGTSYNWHKNNPDFWDELYDTLPNLRQLYFAGGEPLIIDEHYTLLEKCIDEGLAGDIELRYNSNGIEWREDLFDLWKQFRNVIFHFSVDDIDIRNHFIRYPSNWEVIQGSMHKMDAYPHGNLTLTTAWTCTLLNIYYLPEFIKWKIGQNFKNMNKWPHGAGLFSCHIAYWPPQLNVKALPDWFKAEVRQKFEEELYPWLEENWQSCTGVKEAGITYEEFIASEYGIKRMEGLLSFMEADDWSERLPETAEWCYTVAKTRFLNFDEVFPDLEWLKWYNK
tara:strand:- start:24587 stop:26056 length:1470 start_codon:yes stop_codon:yes gene_type:complete